MVLKCKVMITKVLKESRFEAFKDLKEQDVIFINLSLSDQLWWNDYGYSADIKFENMRTKSVSLIPMNLIDEIFDTFDYVQLP